MNRGRDCGLVDKFCRGLSANISGSGSGQKLFSPRRVLADRQTGWPGVHVSVPCGNLVNSGDGGRRRQGMGTTVDFGLTRKRGGARSIRLVGADQEVAARQAGGTRATPASRSYGGGASHR
jgi:hypothetical protein